MRATHAVWITWDLEYVGDIHSQFWPEIRSVRPNELNFKLKIFVQYTYPAQFFQHSKNAAYSDIKQLEVQKLR